MINRQVARWLLVIIAVLIMLFMLYPSILHAPDETAVQAPPSNEHTHSLPSVKPSTPPAEDSQPQTDMKENEIVVYLSDLKLDPSQYPAIQGEIDRTLSTTPWNNRTQEQSVQESNLVRAEGQTRYGTLQVRSQEGESQFRYNGAVVVTGDYRVVYRNLENEEIVLTTIEGLNIAQDVGDALTINKMRVIPFADYDLVLFQPNRFTYTKAFDQGIRPNYAYIVTKEQDATPLTFIYHHQELGMQQLEAFPIYENKLIDQVEDQLMAYTYADRMYELSFSPDPEKRVILLTGAIDRQVEYEEIREITYRYSKRIEQAIGLEDTFYPEGKLDEKELRALFTDKAWDNPGFQYFRQDAADLKGEGTMSRMFGWEPIDEVRLDEDRISFTFTLNAVYAIGLAVHLEVGLKKVDDQWIIYDLGNLKSETLEDFPSYSGLDMPDVLEWE